MKQFSCGDVVTGCTATFSADSEAQLLQAVADHASQAHGIQEVSPELVSQVLSHVKES